MPSSSQYRSPPGTPGGIPTTGAASPGRPGPVQAPPPVTVTNVLPCPLPCPLPGPVVVWTTTALCTNPLRCEKPMLGPAGPMKVSEKNHASWVSFRRIAETPSPPAQSAQSDWSEYAIHCASRAAGSGAVAAGSGSGAFGIRTGRLVLLIVGAAGWCGSGASQVSAMATPAAPPAATPASSRPRRRRRERPGGWSFSWSVVALEAMRLWFPGVDQEDGRGGRPPAEGQVERLHEPRHIVVPSAGDGDAAEAA